MYICYMCVCYIDSFFFYFASFPSPYEGRGFYVLSLVSQHVESYWQYSVECSIVHSADIC